MTARIAPLTLAALLSIACGDNLAPLGADAGGSGSQADAGPGPDAAILEATAFAVATDFVATGVASTIAVPELDVAVNAVEGVASSDPVLRRAGDRLYIVNRLGHDNVTVLDSATLELVAQISTGSGSNPQDVAAVGDTLYVAALNSPGVLVLDLSRPEAGVVDTIDLSALDPEDGLPNCNSIVAAGSAVVAVCGILTQDGIPVPRGPGAVAIIERGALVETVALTQVNPFGLAQAAAASGEPAVLVPTVQDFFNPAAGGCLEQVVLGKGGARGTGCVVENAELGGFVSALAPAPDRLWMTVTTSFDPKDFGPHGDLVSLDPGGSPETVELGDDVRPMDIAVCPTGHLIVSDATRGVRVLTPAAAGELTSAPLNIGLPPVANGLTCY